MHRSAYVGNKVPLSVIISLNPNQRSKAQRLLDDPSGPPVNPSMLPRREKLVLTIGLKTQQIQNTPKSRNKGTGPQAYSSRATIDLKEQPESETKDKETYLPRCRSRVGSLCRIFIPLNTMRKW